MIYYTIKKVSEVTPQQWIASGSRRPENTRLSNDKAKCVLKFSDENAPYFMEEVWLSYDEVKQEIQKEEWDPEEAVASTLQSVVNFFTA